MSTENKTPQEMTLEELKAAAQAELNAQANRQPTQPQATQPTEQPRDEKGRFVSQTSQTPTQNDMAANEEEEDEELEDGSQTPTLFRRAIENEDGTIDVYEAESLEELVDKIAEGKKNANKQLRVLATENKELRTRVAEPPMTKEITADDEYIFSQKLQSKPIETVKEIVKVLTGCELTDFATLKQASDAAAAANARNAAISTFITSHPDYHDGLDADGQKNSDLIAMAMQGQEFNSENLHKAYLRLKSKGLLALKPVEANSAQETTQQPTERTGSAATATAPSQRTKKASGLSTTNRQPIAQPKTEPSEDEMRKLPLDELKERARKQLAGAVS